MTLQQEIKELEKLVQANIANADGYEEMLKRARNKGEFEDIKREQLYHLERAGILHERKLKLLKQL